MADETRIIEERFVVTDQASGPLGKIASSADKAARSFGKTTSQLNQHAKNVNKAGQAHKDLGRSFEQLREHGNRLVDQLKEVALAAGLAFGTKAIIEKFIDTNAEAEEATRRLGATLSGLYQFGKSSPTQNLEKGMERSTELMESFAQKSMALGIPKKELADMAATLAPAMAAAGKKTSDLVGMTSKLAQLSRVFGVGYEESAHAVMGAVEFGMARHNPFLMKLGISGNMLQKMTQAQRMSLLLQRMQGFQPEALAKWETWGDVVGKVRAEMEEMFEVGGKPLFDAAKIAAKDLAKWIGENRDKIREVGKIVAEKFVTGLNAAVALTKTLAAHWDEVKLAVEAIAGIYASVKIANFARGMVGGIQEAMEKAQVGQNIGLAASGIMIAQAGMIGYAIGTAVNGWLQKQQWFQEWTEKHITKSHADYESDRTVQAGKMYEQVIDDQVDTWLNARRAANPQEGMPKSLSYLKGHLDEIKAVTGAALLPGELSGYATRHNLNASTFRLGGAPELAKAEAGSERVKSPQNNFYNSRFDIRQEFAEGYDPDRIAVAFTNELSSIGERRLMSPFTPVGAVR